MNNIANRDGGRRPRVTDVDRSRKRSSLILAHNNLLWAAPPFCVGVLTFNDLLDDVSLQTT